MQRALAAISVFACPKIVEVPPLVLEPASLDDQDGAYAAFFLYVFLAAFSAGVPAAYALATLTFRKSRVKAVRVVASTAAAGIGEATALAVAAASTDAEAGTSPPTAAASEEATSAEGAATAPSGAKGKGKAPPPKGPGKGKAPPPKGAKAPPPPGAKAQASSGTASLADGAAAPKGKGKGPPAPTPKGPPAPKGSGKGPPAPKGSGKTAPVASPKGAPAPKAKAAAEAGNPPIRGPLCHKSIRWRELESVQGTVFSALEDGLLSSSAEQVLRSVFEKKPTAPAKKRERLGTGDATARSAGLELLDRSRAQQLMIMFRKMSVRFDVLCDHLRHISSSRSLDAEDIDLLLQVWPTLAEQKQVRDYDGSRGELRAVEQQVKQLALIPRNEARLRLLRLEHTLGTYSHRANDYMVLTRTACDELMSSGKWRYLLAEIRRIVNFINHGSLKEGVKGFTLEVLQQLRDFKGVDGVSALHCLCVGCAQEDPVFCEALMEELRHVPLAARAPHSGVEEDFQDLGAEVRFAVQELVGYWSQYGLQQKPAVDAGPACKAIRCVNLTTTLAAGESISPAPLRNHLAMEPQVPSPPQKLPPHRSCPDRDHGLAGCGREGVVEALLEGVDFEQCPETVQGGALWDWLRGFPAPLPQCFQDRRSSTGCCYASKVLSRACVNGSCGEIACWKLPRPANGSCGEIANAHRYSNDTEADPHSRGAPAGRLMSLVSGGTALVHRAREELDGLVSTVHECERYFGIGGAAAPGGAPAAAKTNSSGNDAQLFQVVAAFLTDFQKAWQDVHSTKPPSKILCEAFSGPQDQKRSSPAEATHTPRNGQSPSNGQSPRNSRTRGRSFSMPSLR